MKTNEKTVCISDLDWFGKMCVCVLCVLYCCGNLCRWCRCRVWRPEATFALSSQLSLHRVPERHICNLRKLPKPAKSIKHVTSMFNFIVIYFSSLQCMNGTGKNANHRLTNHGMCELSASWPQALDSKVCLAATEAAPGRSGRKSCCLELH